MVTVQGLLAELNEFSPFSLAEKWDNVGLMIGHPSATVSGVLLGLDPCLTLLAEAVSRGLNTIITHHPLLFHPVKKIDLATVEGRMIAFVLQHDLNVIACHTNFDQISGGVSELLARRLGVLVGKPLLPKEKGGECGFGFIGDLDSAYSGADFIRMAVKKLDQPNLMIAGEIPEMVNRIAVCGGSCGDLATVALEKGADIFLTSEVKHSLARWAEDAGACLVDGGHFSTENLALVGLYDFLHTSMGSLDVQLTQSQDRPLRGYVEVLQREN